MYIAYVYDCFGCGYKYLTRLCDDEEEVERCIIAIINDEHNHDEEDLSDKTLDQIMEEFQFSYNMVELNPDRDYTYLPR